MCSVFARVSPLWGSGVCCYWWFKVKKCAALLWYVGVPIERLSVGCNILVFQRFCFHSQQPTLWSVVLYILHLVLLWFFIFVCAWCFWSWPFIYVLLKRGFLIGCNIPVRPVTSSKAASLTQISIYFNPTAVADAAVPADWSFVVKSGEWMSAIRMLSQYNWNQADREGGGSLASIKSVPHTVVACKGEIIGVFTHYCCVFFRIAAGTRNMCLADWLIGWL